MRRYGDNDAVEVRRSILEYDTIDTKLNIILQFLQIKDCKEIKFRNLIK